jgi:hypothetical protein
MTAAAVDVRLEVAEELRLLDVKDECLLDPKALINEIRFFDPSTELWVEFKMFPPDRLGAPVIWLPDGDWKFTRHGADDWYWQSLIIDWWHDPSIKKYLILKARQLGITLLACAYALWLMLYRPGSVCVAYSYTEDEAKKLVEATWAMFQSLPEAVLAATSRSSRRSAPRCRPSGSSSSTRTAHLHLPGAAGDEEARPRRARHVRDHGRGRVQDYAREIYTAINPRRRAAAKLVMISTATASRTPRRARATTSTTSTRRRRRRALEFKFLPWNLEPTRDDEWYATRR